MRPPPGKVFAGLAVVAVAGTIVLSLVVLGPPSRERARRLDQRRVSDLQTIVSAVDAHHARQQAMPSDLEALARASAPGLPRRDSATGQPYEYRALGGKRYELCTVFDAESPLGTNPAGDRWSHRAGRDCFQLEVQERNR